MKVRAPRGTIRRGLCGGVPLSILEICARAAAKTAPNDAGGYLKESLDQASKDPVPLGPPSILPTLINTVLSLAVVVLLIYVVLWLVRRWMASRSAGDAASGEDQLIRVLDRHYLDSKRGVAIVEMGGEVLCLGLGDDVTVLHRVSDPAKAEELRQAAGSKAFFKGFPQQLDRISSLLRTNQWKKNRQSLRSQSEFVKEQVEKLKAGRAGEKD